MARKVLPQAEYLHQRFEYDATTGRLRWRPRPRSDFPTDRNFHLWQSCHEGNWVGTIDPSGYVRVFLDGVQHFAHRVIWKMHHGTEPPFGIDHRDRDRANNRIGNLRAATEANNGWNSWVKTNSASRLKGVAHATRVKKPRFSARISANRQRYYLGYFDTAEEAHAAYCAAARTLHGEFWSKG